MKRIIIGIILIMLYICRLVWTFFSIYEAIVVFTLLGWLIWSGIKATERSKQVVEDAKHAKRKVKW